MDVQFRKKFPESSYVWTAVSPAWKRLWGGFQGLPQAIISIACIWFLMDAVILLSLQESFDMLISHLLLTIGLSTFITLGTAYMIKRQQARMRMVKVLRRKK